MIKKGDIGFIMHHDNKLSKVIAWFMKSKWSHSFVVLDVTPTCVYLLETSDFAVTIGKLDYYLNDKNVSLEIYQKEMPNFVRDRMTGEAEKLYNTVYGYLQLLSLGLRRLLMRFGIKIPNLIRQGVVCDQVGFYALKGSNLPEFRDLDPEAYDTQELLEFVQANGFEVVFSKKNI